jgi:hypothetical protein
MGVIKKRQILFILLAQSFWWSTFSFQASSVSLKRSIVSSTHPHRLTTRERGSASSRRYSSQWDDEEEDDVTTKPAAFDQAKELLKQEDDQEKLTSSGDFDANPSVSHES